MQQNAVKPRALLAAPKSALSPSVARENAPTLSAQEREFVELVADGVELAVAARACAMSKAQGRATLSRPEAQNALKAEREAAVLGNVANAGATVSKILTMGWDEEDMAIVPASIRSKLAMALLSEARKIDEAREAAQQSGDLAVISADELRAFLTDLHEQTKAVDVDVIDIGPIPNEQDGLF